MGAKCSVFRKQKSKLEDKVLNYLFSNDKTFLSIDPHKTFRNEYTEFGYKNLEEFISSIPISVSKVNCYAQMQNDFQICTKGTRYVSKDDEKVRGECISYGKVYNGTEADGKETFASLRLDQPLNGEMENVTIPLNKLIHENRALQKYLRAEYTDKVTQQQNHSLDKKSIENKVIVGTVSGDSGEEAKHIPIVVEQHAGHSDEPSHSEMQKSKGKLPPSNKSKRNIKEVELDDRDSNVISEKEQNKKAHVEITTAIPKKELPATDLKSNSIPKLSSVPSNELDDISKPCKNNEGKIISHPENVNPIIKHRGIVGANNSCYIDSLLFSLFYFTKIFDEVLLKSKSTDTKIAKKFRNVLKVDIVESMREQYFCSAAQVQKLRNCIAKTNSKVSGEMMDVEELIYSILEDVCQEKGFISYEESTDFLHQLIISPEMYENQRAITIQECLNNSLKMWGELKFKSVPNPALMLGIPRSDGELVHFDAIVPNLTLDLQPIITPVNCLSCFKDGHWECVRCLENETVSAFCDLCSENIDSSHENNFGHDVSLVNRRFMDLNAVICIRSAHYVTFVKNFGSFNQWHFFDSMSGQENQVQPVTKLEEYLKRLEKDPDLALSDFTSSKMKRIVTDGHICIYQPRFK